MSEGQRGGKHNDHSKCMVMMCLVAPWSWCVSSRLVSCMSIVPPLLMSCALLSPLVLPGPNTTCWAALALLSPFFAAIAARVKARRLSLFLVLDSNLARDLLSSNPFSNALASSSCSFSNALAASCCCFNCVIIRIRKQLRR